MRRQRHYPLLIALLVATALHLTLLSLLLPPLSPPPPPRPLQVVRRVPPPPPPSAVPSPAVHPPPRSAPAQIPARPRTVPEPTPPPVAREGEAPAPPPDLFDREVLEGIVQEGGRPAPSPRQPGMFRLPTRPCPDRSADGLRRCAEEALQDYLVAAEALDVVRRGSLAPVARAVEERLREQWLLQVEIRGGEAGLALLRPSLAAERAGEIYQQMAGAYGATGNPLDRPAEDAQLRLARARERQGAEVVRTLVKVQYTAREGSAAAAIDSGSGSRKADAAALQAAGRAVDLVNRDQETRWGENGHAVFALAIRLSTPQEIAQGAPLTVALVRLVAVYRQKETPSPESPGGG